jgi:hypothetical protein
MSKSFLRFLGLVILIRTSNLAVSQESLLKYEKVFYTDQNIETNE